MMQKKIPLRIYVVIIDEQRTAEREQHEVGVREDVFSPTYMPHATQLNLRVIKSRLFTRHQIYVHSIRLFGFNLFFNMDRRGQRILV